MYHAPKGVDMGYLIHFVLQAEPMYGEGLLMGGRGIVGTSQQTTQTRGNSSVLCMSFQGHICRQ